MLFTWRFVALLVLVIAISVLSLLSDVRGIVVSQRHAMSTSMAQADFCDHHDVAPPRMEKRSHEPEALALPDETFFVVAAPNFSERCGGCQVLHRLCDRLNVLFADVRETPVCYLVWKHDTSRHPTFFNHGYKTPVLPPWINASDGIAIYPPVVAGGPNPLGASRVVHWILYFPGVIKGPSALAYDPRNFIACYSPGFCRDFGKKYHKVALRVVDYEFAHFVNAPALPASRNGTITFRRKTFFKSALRGRIMVNGTFPVPESPLQDEGKRSRIEQYAKAERFYSMDPVTFRSVEAAMAGALSIVVPVPGVSKAEWLAAVGEEFRYGVAYGEDDIPHARATLPCVMPFMRYLAGKQRGELVTFVRETLEHFKM
jgi:hypothetical protein